LVFGVLLLLLANLAYWFQHALLDGDEFSSTVSDVIARPEAADRIGDVVANRVLESPEVENRIEAALPEEAARLASLFEGQLANLLSEVIARALVLDSAREAIFSAIGRLHTLLVDTLEGRTERIQVTSEGVVLRLDSIVINVLDGLGLDGSQLTSERDLGRVVLVEDPGKLDDLGRLLRIVDDSVPFLFVGSVLAFGGAIGLSSQDRLRGVTRVGLAMLACSLIVLLIWKLGAEAFSSQLGETPVARMILDSLWSGLKTQAIVLLVIGATIVAALDQRVRLWLASAYHNTASAVTSFGVGRTVIAGTIAVFFVVLVT
jgi:hypothetical protein